MKLVAQLVHLLVELISQIASEFRQKQSSAREILINLRLQLRYVEMLQFIYSDIWGDEKGPPRWDDRFDGAVVGNETIAS
jgi:hypothetical protein